MLDELNSKKSLALIRRAIRGGKNDGKVQSAIREVGQLRDATYIRLIADLFDYATLWRPDMRSAVSVLILTALRRSKKIPVATLLSWCDLLSKWRQHREVEDGLEILRRRNIEVPPREIVRLAQAAIDSWEFKRGMLIAYRGKCNYERYLPTVTLCEWVERSTRNFNGNHGAHRLCALLCLRIRHLRVGSQKYQIALETLAQALCDVSKEDFFFESILKGTKQRLRSQVFQEVTGLLRKLFAVKVLEVKKESKERLELIEAISQQPVVP